MTMGENMQISLTTLRFNRVTFHERLVSKCTFLGSRNPMKLFSRHKEKKVLTSHYCQKGEKIITLISLTVNKTSMMHKLGHIISVVSWRHWVFWVLWEIASSKRSEHGWLNPVLCPSVMVLPPLLSPLQPEPSGGFFCCRHVVSYGLSFGRFYILVV